jgi:hypothetical protein
MARDSVGTVLEVAGHPSILHSNMEMHRTRLVGAVEVGVLLELWAKLGLPSIPIQMLLSAQVLRWMLQ